MDECMDYLYEFMKNRTPYELNGATRLLKNRWPKFYGRLNYLAKFCHMWMDDGSINAFEYCRNRFNTIKVDRTRVKPIVKVIGEFWAQTTEGDGNFRMFSFLEKEGAQCIVEPVSTWIPYLLNLAENQTKENRLTEGHSTDSVLQNLKRRTRQRLNYWLDTAQLKLATKIFLREYGRQAQVFGDLPTHLIDQQELARLGGAHYNPLADGGEGHLEIAKSIYYTSRHKAHMILSLKPFGCMPSTQSDGAMAGVVSKYKEMIFLPIETSGEGEINAHSRVQMALGEAKHKTKAEFTQTLEKTGYPLQQIRRYVADHQELETPMYAVPHHPGVVGTAANFVQHVAKQMKRDRILEEVTS
jgi:predicted nucleotide-binding protein (sugar kinase/HSP70/actin superfamily)